MNMFKGLGGKEAVRVGDSYIVNLTGLYMINGEKRNCYSTQVMVGSLDEIKQYTESKVKTLAYKDESDTEYSVEYVESVRSKIQEYYDEFGDYQHSDLDAELQHVKDKAFLRTLTPVTETLPDKITDVDIRVVGSMEDTGSKFIETPLRYGDVSFNGRGAYRVLSGAIAKDEVRNISSEYKDCVVDIPSHSNIYYVKVKSSYLFTKETDDWVKNSESKRIFDKLEDARGHEKSIRDFIRKTMMVHITPEELSSITKGMVHEKVNKLRGFLDDVEPKQKTITHHRLAKETVNEILELIINEGHEEKQ